MGNNTDILSRLIGEATSISITGHTNPDGDCIGAVTAAALFLKSIGKECHIVLSDPIPEYLMFLMEREGSDLRGCTYSYTDSPEACTRTIKSSDLIICLDFNRLGRTGKLENELRISKAKKVLIDHHPDPEENIFSLIFSEPRRSSTCEYLYSILKSVDADHEKSCITLHCSESIFTGILTDTNIFSNSVTPETLRIASELMESGVNKEMIQQHITGGFSENRLRLMGKMIKDKMVLIPELRTAYMILDKNTKKEYSYKDGDSEGFVNMPLSIKDVAISALFTEGDNGEIRVSLRCKEGFVINEFASEYFNGGGHIKAAGGRISMEIEKIPDYFKEKLELYLKRHEF